MRALIGGFFNLIFFLGATCPGHADPVTFGAHDIETLFYISKSDDKNRVDYGMRLTPDCLPARSDESVFYYWREFEHAPPIRLHTTGFLDSVAYGIAEQHAAGGAYSVRLKRLDRAVTIRTMADGHGGCTASATMTIAGVTDAAIRSAFIQLGGFLSIDRIEIYGGDPKTGNPLSERVKLGL